MSKRSKAALRKANDKAKRKHKEAEQLKVYSEIDEVTIKHGFQLRNNLVAEISKVQNENDKLTSDVNNWKLASLTMVIFNVILWGILWVN